MQLHDIATLASHVRSFARNASLTPREQDVLLLLATGTCSVGELARALGIKANTINNHLKGIFERTGVASKAELLAVLFADATARHASTQLFVRPPRVLVAERGPKEQQALEEQLERHGLSVQRVADASRPLTYEEVMRMRVDVVVADEKVARPLLPRYSHEEGGGELGNAPGYVVLGNTMSNNEASYGRFAWLRRPVGNDRIVFATLETSLASPYERSRLIRVPTDVSAILGGTLWSRLSNLSYGGAFIELAHEHMRDPRYAELGTTVQLTFELSPREPIQAQATVLWRREAPGSAHAAGCGVRFDSVSAESTERIQQYVRSARLASLAAAVETRPRRASVPPPALSA
jgi:DNA-binding CsgD family transcriptional regulator